MTDQEKTREFQGALMKKSEIERRKLQARRSRDFLRGCDHGYARRSPEQEASADYMEGYAISYKGC